MEGGRGGLGKGESAGEKEKQSMCLLLLLACGDGQVACDREVVAAQKVTETTRCSEQITRSEAASWQILRRMARPMDNPAPAGSGCERRTPLLPPLSPHPSLRQ